MELHYVGISAAFDPYAQARPGEIKPILPHLWTQSRKTISFLPKVKD